MKVLHTSDWHIGKRLGRFDRNGEHREVLAEVADLADREDVDLVLHSGDVFDRPLPPVEAMRLGFESLTRLSAGGRRPVVAIAGNHDSPGFFEALRPFLEPLNLHLVGEIHSPDQGGVLELETPAGPAVVSCFPFLREGRAFHAWAPPEEHYRKYADRLRLISEAYARRAEELAGTEAVTFLVAHFMVGGAKVHGHGVPRGERRLHMGEAYTATPEAIPPGPQYVAMGHIHAPQPVPGARVPAQYAGSLVELDFGEAGEDKRVVLVDVEPGRPATVTSVPITRGRPLVRATGTWEELLVRDDLREAYLDLTVETTGPDPGLSDRARAEFDFLVAVRASYPAPDDHPAERAGRPLRELFADYQQQETGSEPERPLMDAFRELMEEAGYTSS